MISAMIVDHSRVVVIGSSGAGKTMFARRLAEILNCAHIELDALYWGPNWTPRPGFADRVRQTTAGECWTADGNYSVVRDALWGRATAIVWLNYSFPLVFRRAVKRTLRRALLGETIFGGNRESLLRTLVDPQGVPWWIIRTYRRRRREYRRLFEVPPFPHLEMIEVRSPREGAALLRATAAAVAQKKTSSQGERVGPI
jgi:adenylate kinase family enzyme